MRRLVLALIVFALLAAGLAGAATTPYGSVFQTTIRGNAPQLNGKWLLGFSKTGSYEVAKAPSSAVLIGGSSKLSGHRIVFVDKSGPLACSPAQARGTYTWSLAGKTLRLTPVKEACVGRKTVLASAAFVRIR